MNNAYTMPRYQVSVYRTIGPLYFILGKKSNEPPGIIFPYSRTAGQILIIYTSFLS